MSTSKSAEHASLSGVIICCYVNITSQVQILRISSSGYFFERVLFPKERLLFEAKPEFQLEVHTGTIINSILSDEIPCVRLQVKNNLSSYTK